MTLTAAILIASASESSFDDTTAAAGMTYYYRVVAVIDSTGAVSAPSGEAFYTTGGLASDTLKDGGFESPPAPATRP